MLTTRAILLDNWPATREQLPSGQFNMLTRILQPATPPMPPDFNPSLNRHYALLPCCNRLPVAIVTTITNLLVDNIQLLIVQH